jgi:two-component system phosphate regulon sensor histidine kinase PhoR
MRLRQLFLNLIDNAIRYNKSGGEDAISVENKGDIVDVSIDDTGVSIPKLDLIFERFYRVDKARGGDSGGVGFRLSIAKWIMELYNGKIGVESKVGNRANLALYFQRWGKR